MKSTQHTVTLPNYLRVALASWACRVVTVVVQLLSIPLLTHSLGSEHYAAYAIAVSLMGWFALADLGTGNAIHNFVSEARATKQSASIEIGIVSLVCIGTILIGTLGLVALSSDLAKLLFSQMKAIGEKTGAILVFAAGTLFLCNSMGNVATRLLYGLGYGVAANVMAALSNVIALALLWAATRLWPSQELLIPAFLAYAIPVSLIGFLTGAILFVRYGTFLPAALAPRAASVFSRARGFFLIAVFATAVLNVDYLIMSQTLVPQQITIYNVLSRVFGVALALYGGLLAATGVHWTERIAVQDWHDVRRHSYIYLPLGLLGVTGLTLLLLFWPGLWKILLPSDVSAILPSTIMLFGCYACFRVWTDTATVALQAANETAVLIRWIPIQAIVSIGAQLFLVTHFDINGILLGLVISFAVTVAWVLPRRIVALSSKR